MPTRPAKLRDCCSQTRVWIPTAGTPRGLNEIAGTEAPQRALAPALDRKVTFFWAQPRLTAHFGVRILPTRHIDQAHCEAVRPSAPATLTEILVRTAYFEHRRSNAKSLWWRTLAQPAGVITTSQIHSSYLARARISEFESYHPSHAVRSLRCIFPAASRVGRAEEGRRHCRSQRLGPTMVVEIGGVAGPRTAPLTAAWVGYGGLDSLGRRPHMSPSRLGAASHPTNRVEPNDANQGEPRAPLCQPAWLPSHQIARARIHADGRGEQRRAWAAL